MAPKRAQKAKECCTEMTKMASADSKELHEGCGATLLKWSRPLPLEHLRKQCEHSTFWSILVLTAFQFIRFILAHHLCSSSYFILVHLGSVQVVHLVHVVHITFHRIDAETQTSQAPAPQLLFFYVPALLGAAAALSVFSPFRK